MSPVDLLCLKYFFNPGNYDSNIPRDLYEYFNQWTDLSNTAYRKLRELNAKYYCAWHLKSAYKIFKALKDTTLSIPVKDPLPHDLFQEELDPSVVFDPQNSETWVYQQEPLPDLFQKEPDSSVVFDPQNSETWIHQQEPLPPDLFQEESYLTKYEFDSAFEQDPKLFQSCLNSVFNTLDATKTIFENNILNQRPSEISADISYTDLLKRLKEWSNIQEQHQLLIDALSLLKIQSDMIKNSLIDPKIPLINMFNIKLYEITNQTPSDSGALE